ncbi:MAG: HEAT repeat domain-containing protein [Candidatus Saccharicenans sp.]|nr:HEAT repeat domain-containing protein [Candidatus Saccharicenans sp.]
MNSPGNTLTEVEQQDRATIQLTKEIFSLFSLAVTSLKLFPPQHSTVVRFVDELYAKLKEYFAEREELEVEVQEDSFLMNGEVVHKEDNLVKSLPYLFHKDGTRKFTLLKGMDKHELFELLDVIRSTALLPPDEGGIVLAIWEKDFAHVRLYAPDDYLLSKIDIFTRQPVDFSVDKNNLFSGQIELSVEDLKEIQSKKLALGLMEQEEEKDQAQILAEMEEEKRLIDDLLTRARQVAPEIEFHGMMCELLSLETRPDRIASILKFLERHQRELIQDGKLAYAVHLLRKVLELKGEFCQVSPEKAAEIDKFMNEVSGARTQDLLRETVIGKKFDSLPALLEYLRLLGEQSVPLAVELLDQTQEPETRAEAINYLKEIGQDNIDLIAYQLRDDRPAIMKEVINLLGQHPSKKTLAYLLAVSTYENKEIKLAAIETLGASAEPLAQRILLSFIEDKDEEIGVAAAERLRYSGDNFILKKAIKMVQSRKFNRLAPELRTAILCFLVRSGTAEGLDAVRRSLGRPGFINRHDRLITRLCAVEALNRVRTPGGLDLLKRGAKFLNKRVREACERVIATWEQGEHNQKAPEP